MKQNLEMLLALEEEQTNEAHRDEILRKTKEGKEKKKLAKEFLIERQKADLRLLQIAGLLFIWNDK